MPFPLDAGPLTGDALALGSGPLEESGDSPSLGRPSRKSCISSSETGFPSRSTISTASSELGGGAAEELGELDGAALVPEESPLRSSSPSRFNASNRSLELGADGWERIRESALEGFPLGNSSGGIAYQVCHGSLTVRQPGNELVELGRFGANRLGPAHVDLRSLLGQARRRAGPRHGAEKPSILAELLAEARDHLGPLDGKRSGELLLAEQR